MDDMFCGFWFEIQCDHCGEVATAGATHGVLCGPIVWFMAICPICGCGTLIRINYHDFMRGVLDKEEP